MHDFAVTRVRERIHQGSSSPVVVETEAGLFVAKLRGAGHGVLALVAEIIVAELAEAIGLPVPERAFLELAPDAPTDDKNDELADLLQASIGTNVGFRLLEGAREPRPEELARLDDDFVARVLWLDGLVMNFDRTAKNPNLLFWKKQPWLIDHGASLPFHHNWSQLSEDAPHEPMSYAGHVFEQRVALLARFDPLLAPLLTREVLAGALEQVPDDFLTELDSGETPARRRAAYQAFLWKRLKAPRGFISP